MSVNSFAGNEHEHLVYYPKFSDLQIAFEKKGLENIPANQVFGGSAEMLLDIYEPGIAQAFLTETDMRHWLGMPESSASRRFLKTSLNHSMRTATLKDVFKKIRKYYLAKPGYAGPTDKSFFAKSLFEYTPELHSMPDLAYLNLGGLRSVIALKNPNGFVKSVSVAVSRRSTTDVMKTSFSVPADLFQISTLEPVQKAVEKANGQVDFYYSMPRRYLFSTGNRNDRMFEALKFAKSAGFNTGIDISGSILEAFENMGDYPEKNVSSKLRNIFEFSSKNKLPVRVHAFEGSNKGIFYNALWSSLETCKTQNCLPPELHIGHINHLRAKDILRFREFKNNSQLIFEANLESNELAQKSTFELKKFIETIELLHKNRFRVALGADGYGILGSQSGFLPTLKRLKDGGLSGSSLKKLISESTIPQFGTNLKPIMIKKWASIQSYVEEQIFPSVNEASISKCGSRALRQIFRFTD